MATRGYRRLVLTALAASMLAGCGRSVFRQPEVTLQQVEIGGLGLRGGTLLVNLAVANPNRFTLNANQLRYGLEIGGSEEPGDTSWIEFATGSYDEPFSVAAGDTATVRIPVEFSYAGLGSAANSLLRAGTFDYRATGTVDVRTPLGSHEVPFRKTGTITLVGMQ